MRYRYSIIIIIISIMGYRCIVIGGKGEEEGGTVLTVDLASASTPCFNSISTTLS